MSQETDIQPEIVFGVYHQKDFQYVLDELVFEARRLCGNPTFLISVNRKQVEDAIREDISHRIKVLVLTPFLLDEEGDPTQTLDIVRIAKGINKDIKIILVGDNLFVLPERALLRTVSTLHHPIDRLYRNLVQATDRNDLLRYVQAYFNGLSEPESDNPKPIPNAILEPESKDETSR